MVESGILVGYDNIVVDTYIIQLLPQYGFEAEFAERCIEANKHNSTTAAYFLLLKKHIENGRTVAQTQDYQVLPSPHKLNHTISYTPRPPLFKLSYEKPNPIQHRFRRYVDPKKRAISRRTSRGRGNESRIADNKPKPRPSTGRTISVPRRGP